MGVWGADLFSDDVACDIRDHYRELLEDGVDDRAATQQTVERFGPYLEEPDGVAVLALALTQSKLGRLDSDIRDRALAVLDRGGDLEIWQRDNPKQLSKRRAMLDKARFQLTGPQPPRKPLRPPKRTSSGLAAGDVLALALPHRLTVLRVVRVHVHRLGETPVLEELAVEGTEVPSRDALEGTGPKLTERIALMGPSSSDTRFFAFVMKRIDWQRAGFQKVQTIRARVGDEQAPVPAAGISWAALAERYRSRLAE